MYRVGSIVYDKNENIQDKLTTVYSGVFSLRNCGIMMLINAKKIMQIYTSALLPES